MPAAESDSRRKSFRDSPQLSFFVLADKSAIKLAGGNGSSSELIAAVHIAAPGRERERESRYVSFRIPGDAPK